MLVRVSTWRCKSRPAKASKQAGSECCHSPGDWWVRSVHSKEAGREDYYCCDADVHEVAEGSIRDDRNCEGRTEIALVASSGHVSKGIPQEPRRARHFSAHQKGLPPYHRWIPLSGFSHSTSVPPLPSFPQRDNVLLHFSEHD